MKGTELWELDTLFAPQKTGIGPCKESPQLDLLKLIEICIFIFINQITKAEERKNSIRMSIPVLRKLVKHLLLCLSFRLNTRTQQDNFFY